MPYRDDPEEAIDDAEPMGDGPFRRSLDVVPDANRGLGDAQMLLLGLDEHLGFHAKVALLQNERFDRTPGQRPETRLGIRHGTHRPEGGEEIEYSLSYSTMDRHLARPQPPDANDEIRFISQDRREESGDVCRVVLCVAIEEHQRVETVRPRMFQGRLNCDPFSGVNRVPNDIRPREFCDTRGPILRAVVYNKDLIGVLPAAQNHAADRYFLVVGGNRDQDLRHLFPPDTWRSSRRADIATRRFLSGWRHNTGSIPEGVLTSGTGLTSDLSLGPPLIVEPFLQKPNEGFAELLPREAQLQMRLEPVEFRANIVSAPVEDISIYGLFAAQEPQGVRELDLARLARRRAPEAIKDPWCEDVSPGDSPVRGRLLPAGLLDKFVDEEDALSFHCPRHDPI